MWSSDDPFVTVTNSEFKYDQATCDMVYRDPFGCDERIKILEKKLEAVENLLGIKFCEDGGIKVIKNEQETRSREKN